MRLKVFGVNKILGTLISCKNGPAVCLSSSNALISDYTLRDDDCLKACIIKSGECKKITLPASCKIKKEDKWFNAIKGVYLVLSRKHPKLPAFDITLDGSLLDCEGHIVYSAIAYSTVLALDKHLRLNLTKNEIIDLVSDSLKAVSEVGNLSDVVTMINSDSNGIIVFNGINANYEVFDNPFKGSEYSMLIIDGHVPVASLREEKRSMEKEIRNVCDKYSEKYCCPVIDFLCPDFKERCLPFNEDEKRLFKYMYEEHKAAYRIVDVIKQKDVFALGRVLDRVRTAFDENLDMICPEIEWIVKRAYETPGCVGSCIFFEGFSAKAIVILKKSSVEAFKKNIEEYQHIFGFDLSLENVGDKF